MTAAASRALKLLLVVLAVAGVARPNHTWALPGSDDASIIAAEKGIATVAVSIDGRVLFRVRGVTAFPAAERAAAIASRIREMAADESIPASALRPVDSDHSTNIVVGETMIMEVSDADAIAEAPGLTRQALALIYLRKISSAVQQYRAERTPEQLGRSMFRAAVWSGLLALALLLMILGLRWMMVRIEHRYHSAIEQIESGTFRLIRAGWIWIGVRFIVRLVMGIASFAIFYAYLHIVLNLFPWTRPVSVHLRALTLAPLLALAGEVAAAIPSLLILLLIVLAARYVMSLARLFFSALEKGTIKVAAFDVDWSKPTFNIVRILIIAFAAMIAYPYIPGSQSAAFKGVTIFLGVLFSLGSSSFLANIIAGYTMTYRRAFHVGDRIKVGDLMGDVVEIGLMVTHLRSLKNEELVIPNSLLLSSNIINYTSHARQPGLLLHTTVGIGYETPWRQVEAMLLLAAERTPGLLRDPAPFVLQQSLGDYAVNYELNVYCDKPSEMYRLYTELHRSVLDVFNEYNVQIMTPSYIADPAQPKMVPKEHWFEKPAQTAAQQNPGKESTKVPSPAGSANIQEPPSTSR
jgi:small-conductance mechanosensitive channel